MLAYWFAVAKACFCWSVFGFSVARKSLDALRVGQGDRDRQRVGVEVSAAPKRLVSLDDSRLDLVPQGLGLRPILRERLIEPQDLGGKPLQFGLLGRVIRETDADQRSQNQRQEQSQQPRHLPDHALRLAGLVLAASRFCTSIPA